jgi:hypothetical protein
MKFINKIKFHNRIKYNNAYYNKKDFKKFFFIRKNLLNYNIIKQKKKDDYTYNLIKKFKNYNYSEIIYKFYKKFEANQKLKSKYDSQYKALSNKETNINTYIHLGLAIKKIRKINKFQKLNAILKIVDKVIIKIKQLRDLTSFKKLLKYEKKLINSILKNEYKF